MAAGAELLKRYFLTEIQPKLFPANLFLSRALNDDAFVNNNTVELPHAGTLPNVVVDRNLFPASISQRTDAATNYTMEELTTDPTLLRDSESLTVAYNKRSSILDQHAKQINTKAGTRALYKWAAGAAGVGTGTFASTGTARAAGNSTGAQTGNRKAFTVADIINMQNRFFADDIETDITDIRGVAVITPRQYADLIAIDEFKRYDALGTSNIPTGVIKRAYGFDFYVRSAVVSLASDDTLRAEGAAGATTTQDCAVFYSPDYVRKAVGSIKPFVDTDKPEFYGSIFSMMVRFGAAPARNDNKGVYLLFEDNA
jgi:hypothetical protein